MSEGNGNPTIVGATTKLAQALIGALPPAFLLLCLINAAFLGVVLWFVDAQLSQRTALVEKVIDRCFDNALKDDH